MNDNHPLVMVCVVRYMLSFTLIPNNRCSCIEGVVASHFALVTDDSSTMTSTEEGTDNIILPY